METYLRFECSDQFHCCVSCSAFITRHSISPNVVVVGALTSPDRLSRRFLDDEEEDAPTTVMPPSSAEQALSFKRGLDHLIAHGDVRTVFADSIEADWRPALGVLFERLKEEMKPLAIRIADIFSYQDWILKLLSDNWPIQELAEGLVLDDPLQMRIARDFFFRVLPDPTIRLDVTPNVVTLIERLLKRYSKSEQAPVLRSAIHKLFTAEQVTGFLTSVINAINDVNQSWAQKFGPLAENFDSRPTTIALCEERFRELVVIIREGTPGQQRDAIAFITAAAPRLRTVSFAPSIAVLIEKVAPGVKNEAAIVD
jgi:hypothetical protein